MRLLSKLTLTTVALVLGTTVSLSLYFYVDQRGRLIETVYNEEKRVLLNLVHIAQEALLMNDDLLLVRYTSALPKWNPALLSASVVTPTGGVLAHTRPEEIGHLQKSEPQHAAVYLITQPIRLGTRWVGTASVAFSKDVIEAQIRAEVQQLRRHVLQVGAICLACGILFALIVALSWTRPITRLSVLAEGVGRGDWWIQTGSMAHRQDEIGGLARSFEQMATQLRELDRMKEDFVSAVTHELRSPLGAIESYLNLIEHETQKGRPTEGWSQYGERLRINTQRLNQFVNDLLDVAALERGKVVLQKEPTSISTLLEEVGEFYRPKLAEKNLELGWALETGLPRLRVDPDKLRQVVINLLSNAIKFTPSGGRVTLGAGRIQTGVQIRVSDTGPGISVENQKRIFNKFEQVQASRQAVKGAKGTGLGLSICKALVELHGGSLHLTSELSKGSTFYVDLPLEDKEPVEVA